MLDSGKASWNFAMPSGVKFLKKIQFGLKNFNFTVTFVQNATTEYLLEFVYMFPCVCVFAK